MNGATTPPTPMGPSVLVLPGSTKTFDQFKVDDNECRKLGYKGSKRYTRLTITPVANASAALLAAVAVLGHPAVAPTANPPA